MKEQWYMILKEKAYCAGILDIFCGLHDYMITEMIYDYKNRDRKYSSVMIQMTKVLP